MKQFINKLLNKPLIFIIAVCIFVFVFYTIFEQIFNLTKFTIKYNDTFDYGNYMKGVCFKEYFEFETSRFQVASTQKDIELSNSSKHKYITFLLVVTILASLFISMLFGLIVNDTLYNSSWLNDILGLGQKIIPDYDDNTSLITKIIDYIQLLIQPIMNYVSMIFRLGKYLFFKNPTNEGIITRIIFFIMIILIYILVIGATIIMPVYIGLKLYDKIDISPFNTNFQVYIPYIVAFSLIFLLRLGYSIFQSQDIISNYFKDNIDKMFTSDNVSGYIVFYLLMAVYITMFYILGNVINIYTKFKKDPEYQENVTESNDIFYDFINRTFGFNEYNNYEVQNVFIYNISGIVMTIAIILVVVLVVYYIMSLYGMSDNASNLAKFGIGVPLVSLFIILFTILNSTEFNNIINKYMLQNPSLLYKQYINILNQTFNPILESEYNANLDTQAGYICKNTGNAIILTLYSDLFNNISQISRTGETGEDTINITPEFEYEIMCEKIYPFKFHEADEYKISFYLNSKLLQKSIFYKYNKCTSVNTDAFMQIIKNHKLINLTDIDKIIKDIYNAFFNGSDIKTESRGLYIKNTIINKYEDARIELKNIKQKLINQIHNAIMNVEANNTYNDSKKLVITKDETTRKYYQQNKPIDISDIEVYEYNNNLNEVKEVVNTTINGNLANTIEDIVDTYMNILYNFLYVYTPFYEKLYITKDKVVNPGDDKYQMLQDTLIADMVENITKSFDKINHILEKPLSIDNNNKITKYVISNYNNSHVNNTYKKNWLDIATKADVNIVTDKDERTFILVYTNILNKFFKLNEDINGLIVSLEKNNYKTPVFVFTLQTSKLNCTNLMDELKKYNDNDEFKNVINKKILRNDDNQYDINYEINGKPSIIDGKDVYNIMTNMLDLCLNLLSELENKYNIFIKNNITDTESDKLNTIEINVKKYNNVLVSNVHSFNSDIQHYDTKNKYVAKPVDPNVILTIDLSRKTQNECATSDKMVYMMCINYFISIVLTNFIYNI